MADKPNPTTVHFTTTWVHLGIFGTLVAVLLAAIIGVSTAFMSRIDARFDAVDIRFDAVDIRFDAVDTRFDAVDRRLDTLETDLRTLTGEVNDLSVRVARIEGHLQIVADDDADADTVAQQ